MLPAMGSKMKHAISWFSLIKVSKASLSLNGITCVSLAISSGTPALLGFPPVARPDPALTSSESAWPW